MSLNLSEIFESSLSDSVLEDKNIIEATDDKSYFLKSLENIASINEKYNIAVKDMYTAINEIDSKPEDNKQARLAFLNFNNKCRTILEDTIKKLDADSRNFIFCFKNKYKEDSKNILTNEKFIKTYAHKEFTQDVYKFTNIEKKIPNYDKISSMYRKDNKEIMNKLTSDKLKSDINETIRDLAVNLSTVFFDDFRGAIMGSMDPIYKENFSISCFNVFRNNGDHNVSLITSEEIKKTLEQFKKSKEYINYIDKDISSSKKAIVAIKSELFDYAADGISDDNINAYTLYFKIKTKQLIEMLSIFILVMSAKMDAVSDMYLQNVSILYTSLTNIKNTGKEDEEDD